MYIFKEPSHLPGTSFSRYLFRYLFVFLWFLGPFLYGSPGGEVLIGAGSQPNLIPSVSGPDTVCNGTGGYIYTTESGMTAYIWTLSSGGTITSGAGTNSIIVSWSQAGAGAVTVTYATATTPGTLGVTVLPFVNASITVSPSNNPVCAGNSVTFTSTIVNGGTLPVLQWLVNGVPVGGNNFAFTYTPSNGDAVTCELSSNAMCTSLPQVISPPAIMMVNPLLQSGVFISPSSNPVCQGTQVTFTAVPLNGGSAPAYQWKVNGLLTGSNNSTFSLVPANGDLVVCDMTSNATCITGNPAGSNPVSLTVSPAQSVSVSVIPSANPVCQGTAVTFSAIPGNGGTSPQYQWKVNNVQVGSASNIFTYVPVNGDAVICQLTSNASCATGNPAISAPVVMLVNQIVPVSVSIQVSSNPACQGVPVTFIANPVNGGSFPVYQWTLNGFPVGTNSTSYTCIPANGDAVLCKLYSSASCQSVFPAISNTVTMMVNPVMPVSISITSSANPVCVASSVTITATPFNGGTLPNFEWKVNGNTVGTNSVTYTYVPNNGDQVVCLMTSNANCAPATPIVSNTLTMTVSPQLPVSVSILASANPVCQNVQVVYVATPINGGSSPVFQWKVNGINSGSGNPVFTHTPVNGDQVSCVLTSGAACASGNPAMSNIISMTVLPSAGVPVSITITPSSNPSCAGQPVTFTAVAVNGGSAPVYAWTVNGLSVGINSPGFTYIPSNGDFIRCWVTSDLTCATNNPAGSNEIAMTVNAILPVSVSIICSANPACLGSAITYTANAVNPGSSPVYQWKVDGVNVGTNQNTLVYSPVNGNVVTCLFTSGRSCSSGNPATSNAITMSVMPVLPVGISISTLTNPSCTGSQVVFHASISNGGTSPVYQWKLNGIVTGSNNPDLTFTPATGNVITCKLTSNALCYSGNKVVTSNVITMEVSPELAPHVSIAASANPFCDGNPVTFNAAPTNGGTLPVYQWRVNCLPAGTNNAAFTYTPSDGDFVTCQMTSNLSCAVMNPCKSNGISMKHNTGTPAGIAISASSNPVCPGAMVAFTATPLNGGATPVYQWKVNGNNAGSNSPGFTYSPANGDVVTCRLTSNASCVSGNPVLSNSLTMIVSPALPAGITISTRTNPFCPGTAVSFTAVSTNGGSSPSYQWHINGLAAGTNSTSFTCFPNSGDIVTCSLMSNATCLSGANPVTSDPVNLQSGTTVPVTISAAASANPVCSGASVTFTAEHSGGGNNPVFAWYVNGNPVGISSPVFSYVPVNGDVVNCTLTSDLTCGSPTMAVSNNTIMTVNPSLPVSVSIMASANPCCIGSPVSFTAATQNGGVSPVFQWIVNCLNVGTNSAEFTYIPSNGDVVVCRVLSDALCSTGNPAPSNNINMVVLPIQPVSVSILPTFNPFCVGNPITFNATPTNGGAAAVYQWQVNHVNTGFNNPIFTYSPADGDTVDCILNSSAVCISGNPAVSNEVVMIGNESLPVTISIAASNNPICYTTLVAFTATTTNAGNSPNFQWKVNGNNAGPNHHTYQYAPAIGDVVSCVLTTSLSCATPNPATSNSINMTVYPQAPVSVNVTASQNPTCQGTTVTFTAVVTNGGTAPLYRWRVNGIIVGTNSPTYSYSPVNGDIVYCRVTSNATCATGNPSNSNQITMNISPLTPAGVSIVPSSNPVCAGSTVVFTATPSNGGTAPVYQWKVNGINTGANSAVFSYSPLNGDLINCELTSNSICTTVLNALSNTIVMTVSAIQTVSVSVLPSFNPVCTNSYVNYTAVTINGGMSPQYQWKVNGSVVGTNTPGYTYIPGNGDVVTCTLTSGLSCIAGNPATSNPIVMSVSSSLPVSVILSSSENPSCQGQPVDYTALGVNGGYNPVYQWMVNGINVGSNTSAYTFVPAQGDYVNCRFTSDFSCATGNPAVSVPVVMEVNPNLPTAISIVSSGNPACVGTMLSYTANPVNGGVSPVYQWKVNGINVGANSPDFSFIPVFGDSVNCLLTSAIACPANNPVMSNTIIMNVVEPAPIGVSVSASQNPTCQGNQVTFTTTPENGGYNPSYQWKVNGVNAGTGQASYSFIPSNGNVVVCELTSSAACISSTTVQSDPVTMNVSTELPVSVTIQASLNPVCIGQPVIYTLAVVNGGNFPAYQWMVNNINVGTDDPVLTFTPSEGDTVACLVTSDFSCATGNPALSNLIIMSVTSPVPAGISISAIANPVCLGSNATFAAVTVNAGISPVFQWKVNGIIAGGNQATFSYIPVNGDIISCLLTATDPCSSGNPVLSNQIVMAVSSDLPVNVTITSSSNDVCAGTPVTFTASAENGGSSPFYQWKVNELNVGTNASTYSYTPADGDHVQCILTSGLSCATGNPDSSNSILMTVHLPQTVSVAISVNPPGAVCAGSTVQMIAIPSNGGTTPIYQWFKNGVPVGSNQPLYSFTPSNGDQVYVTLISNLQCSVGSPAVSATVTQVVTEPLLVSVSAGANLNNVCEGTSVTFTAAPVNGGTPSYQWHVNGLPVGLNQPIYNYVPAYGDMVYVTMTSSLACVTGSTASSNVIMMIVSSLLPVSVTIGANQNPVCQGIMVTYTASPVNGGSPVYQWFLNGVPAGFNQPVFSDVPDNGDQVYVQMTSGLICTTNPVATSNIETMVVNVPLTAGVSIAVNQNPVCQGTEVAFSAIPSNGGNPSYQWYKNNQPVGSNQFQYTCIPADGDQVYVEMSSTLTCVSPSIVTSNIVTLIVENQMPVSVTVTESQNNVCDGTTVSFTAIPVNGGVPIYQWYVNGLPAGQNLPSFNYVPANGDMVYVVMTSSLACVSASTVNSNVITMIVNDMLTVSVTIAADQNPVCQGTSVTLTATPVNGGIPVYQWFLNGNPAGSDQPVFSLVPDNDDEVYVEMSSTLSCVNQATVTSGIVTLSVGVIMPVSVTVAESQNNVCEGTNVTFTATGINGGTPEYQWFKNGIPLGINELHYTCVPLNGDRVYVEMTSDLPCATPLTAVSNFVEMVVNPQIPIDVSIVSDASHVCLGTVVTFTATPLNGGDPIYQWYKNGLAVGTNQINYSCAPADGDEVYLEMTTSLACVNSAFVISDTIRTEVDDPLGVNVSIVADKNEVCEGTLVTFTALPVNGGLPVFQWFKNDIPVGNNDVRYSCIPDSGDRIYLEMTSSLFCVTATKVVSNQLMPLVKNLPGQALSITGPSSVCIGSPDVIYSILPVSGADSYIWNLPAGVTIAGDEHEKTIVLNFNESSISGGISVYGNNACGSGGFSPAMQVAVFPIPETPVISRDGNTLTSSVLTGNQWFFEGSLIPDSIGQTILPKQNGWYWSAVTENGCISDTSKHIFFDGVFPGPITSEPGFWVYPVPNDGHFTVAISLPAEDTFDITVYNCLGMQLFKLPGIVVKSKFKRIVDLRPKMPKGLYTVIFKCDDYQVVKKVLIYNR